MADENDSININIGGSSDEFALASRRAQASTRDLAAEQKTLESAFARIQNALNPLWAAEQRYNQELTENFKLWQAGVINAQRLAQANEISAQSLNAATAAVEANSEAAKKAAADKAAAAAAEKAAQVASATQTAQAQAQAAAQAASEAKQASADATAAQLAGDNAAVQSARALAAAKATAAQEAADASKVAAQEAAQIDRQAANDAKQASDEAARSAVEAGQAKRAASVTATASARTAAQAAKDQARSEQQLTQAVEQFRAQLNPVVAAQQNYNNTMRTATELLMQNMLEEGEWIQIQQRAQQTQELQQRSLGRLNTGYVNLGYQIQDVTASMVTGINPLVILGQQAGQTASAVAQMGGKFSGAAAFIAGPYGAAILGAILVAGLLIEKLYDTRTALEIAGDAERDFRKEVDETTGSIKDQTTALQVRAAVKQEQDLQAKAGDQIDSAKNKVAGMINSATAPQSVSSGPGIGVVIPADIQNGRSVAELRALSTQLKSGAIDFDQFTGAVNRLASRDPQVKRLNSDLLDFLSKRSKGKEDSIIDMDQQLQASNARQKVLLGQNTSDHEKHLAGIKTTNERLGQSYFEAAAEYAITTDPVKKAQAALTMGEAKANIVREDTIGKTHDEAAANLAYVKTLEPLKKAVEDAQNAKKDANKADAEARRQARAEAAAERKEEKEQLEASVAEADYQKQAATQSYDLQVQWQNKKIDLLKAYYGETSKQAIDAQRELERMEQQHQRTLTEIDQSNLDARAKMEEDHLKSVQDQQNIGLDMAGADLQNQRENGTINPLQQLAGEKALAEQRYQIEQDVQDRIFALELQRLQDRLAIYKTYGDEYAKQTADLENQIVALEKSHDDQRAVNAANLAKQQQQYNNEMWQNIRGVTAIGADSIGNSLNTTFQDIWTHQHKFGADMIALADNLVESYVQAGFKMLANWLATETAKTAASLLHLNIRKGAKTADLATDQAIGAAKVATHVGNEAVMTSASIAAGAAQTATKATATGTQTAIGAAGATAELGQRAATAAAGAYSSTVVIPFIGPVSAPLAAALALAAVMGFGALISAEGGLGEVPSDQLAMVHKKEMILPAWIAEPLRQSLRGTTVPGSASLIGGASIAGADARAATHGGQQNNMHYSPTVSGGGGSLEEMLNREAAQFRKWFNNQARNGYLKYPGK